MGRFCLCFFRFFRNCWLNQLVAQPDGAADAVEGKFHAAAFAAAVHLDDLPLHLLPEGIGDRAAVAFLRQTDGAQDAVMVLQHGGEGQVLILKEAFLIPQPAEDAGDPEGAFDGAFRIQEDVAGEHGVGFVFRFALHPLALDDLRGDAADAPVPLDDMGDNGALLGLAEQAAGVHALSSFPDLVPDSCFWAGSAVPGDGRV